MSEVVFRDKSAVSALAESPTDSVSTPPVIRELKNYHPFATNRAFRLSRIRRDSFVSEHRSIGVLTSGGDASGNFSTMMYLSDLVLKHWVPVESPYATSC